MRWHFQNPIKEKVRRRKLEPLVRQSYSYLPIDIRKGSYRHAGRSRSNERATHAIRQNSKRMIHD